MLKKETFGWLEKYLKESNTERVVLGISGGKDSTVVAMLMTKLIGKENVYGLLLPDGEQKDISDSLEVVKTLGINYSIINIKEATTAIINSLPSLNNDARLNIAPRVRMTTLYAFAQNINARVCGTGNASERYVGYFTKWGDGACDFNPIAHLTSLEVVELGLELAKEFNLRKELITKVASDGLSFKESGESISDEEKLGVSYKAIHDTIRHNPVPKKDALRIEVLHFKNKHKLDPIPTYYNKW